MRTFFLFSLFGLLACSSSIKLPIKMASQAIEQNFAQAFNSPIDSLWEQYHPEAVLIGPTGKVYASEADRRSRLESLQKDLKNIKGVQMLTSQKAGYRQNFNYEIGSFQSNNQQEYAFVLVSQMIGKQYLRKLEMIVPLEGKTPRSSVLKPFREKWIQLCNQHDAEALVNQVYTRNTLYYNHKPMVIGREAVTKEYAYMNNEAYQLHLEPISILPIQAGLIFEIGQCSGSYNDKYILVWQLQEDGNWQVLMDSNI